MSKYIYKFEGTKMTKKRVLNIPPTQPMTCAMCNYILILFEFRHISSGSSLYAEVGRAWHETKYINRFELKQGLSQMFSYWAVILRNFSLFLVCSLILKILIFKKVLLIIVKNSQLYFFVKKNIFYNFHLFSLMKALLMMIVDWSLEFIVKIPLYLSTRDRSSYKHICGRFPAAFPNSTVF